MIASVIWIFSGQTSVQHLVILEKADAHFVLEELGARGLVHGKHFQAGGLHDSSHSRGRLCHATSLLLRIRMNLFESKFSNRLTAKPDAPKMLCLICARKNP
jgi:hypothetical protein